MRAIAFFVVLSATLITGCATAPSSQTHNGPSCSSGPNGQSLGCAATIGVSAIIKAAQRD